MKRKCLPCGRTLPDPEECKIDLNKVVEELNAFAVGKNLNQSEVRNKILEVTSEQETHFSVQELVKIVQKRYPHIGKSTVYRNLSIFMECGLIKRSLTDLEGRTLYEFSGKPHHDHIVCLDCHQIIEFRDADIERRQSAITQRMNFSVEGRQSTIYSRCKLLPHQKKSRSSWAFATGGMVAVSMAIAMGFAAMNSGVSRSHRLKTAESAMMQNCQKEFGNIVAGKTVDQVDHWAEAQENAAPGISSEFKKTRCYVIHEVWEKIAQRNEWAPGGASRTSG